jgi:hypothetical protein
VAASGDPRTFRHAAGSLLYSYAWRVDGKRDRAESYPVVMDHGREETPTQPWEIQRRSQAVDEVTQRSLFLLLSQRGGNHARAKEFWV